MDNAVLRLTQAVLAAPSPKEQRRPFKGFPRMSAVIHHGGAGSTMAGLRAGKPTVIVPFIGDQSFWGRVVHQSGFGTAPIPQKELTAERLAAAVQQALEPPISARTQALGAQIRAEDGTGRAVAIIEQLAQARQ